MELATEMGVLTCLMILAASMWIPYVIGIATDPSKEDAFDRPADQRVLRHWVQRAYRAHQNLLEQAMPFAVFVLILNAMQGFTSLTYWTAIAFFWIRIAHAAGMISGLAKEPLRPILFTAGWVCCMIMAYSIFAAR